MEKKKFVRKQERFVLFLMLLLLFPLGALAQQKLIKGTGGRRNGRTYYRCYSHGKRCNRRNDYRY